MAGSTLQKAAKTSTSVDAGKKCYASSLVKDSGRDLLLVYGRVHHSRPYRGESAPRGSFLSLFLLAFSFLSRSLFSFSFVIDLLLSWQSLFFPFSSNDHQRQ
jgi:hypothetical protein